MPDTSMTTTTRGAPIASGLGISVKATTLAGRNRKGRSATRVISTFKKYRGHETGAKARLIFDLQLFVSRRIAVWLLSD